MKRCAENFNHFCPDYPGKCHLCGAFRELTNADRIRAMSDEELADILYRVGYDNGWDTPEYALEWLQSPAGEDTLYA